MCSLGVISLDGIYDFTPLWGVWEIEALIGEGGFGKVYKAVRQDFDKEFFCAIKHISVPQSDSETKQFLDENMSNDIETATEYFKQVVQSVTDEIAIMYSLKGNTNIVSYEEHLVVPKKNGIGYDIFIKMEHLVDLPQRVKQGAFTTKDIIRLGIDICTALEMCAEKGLIHRDIKPQNIFVNSKGDFKLGDFGISRQLEKTAMGLSKKGTYSYMAPEIYRGENYGPSIDVYSLGLVMYRLLNGNRLPFYPLAPNPVRFEDGEKALKLRMTGEAIPAPAFADAELTQIVLKMCTFERDDRFHSAAEVKKVLLELQDSADSVVPMVAEVGQDGLTKSVSMAGQENDVMDGLFFSEPIIPEIAIERSTGEDEPTVIKVEEDAVTVMAIDQPQGLLSNNGKIKKPAVRNEINGAALLFGVIGALLLVVGGLMLVPVIREALWEDIRGAVAVFFVAGFSGWTCCLIAVLKSRWYMQIGQTQTFILWTGLGAFILAIITALLLIFGVGDFLGGKGIAVQILYVTVLLGTLGLYTYSRAESATKQRAKAFEGAFCGSLGSIVALIFISITALNAIIN